MANTEGRKLGPDEVNQKKEGKKIVENTVEEKDDQTPQTELEEKQEKLDRGEELYTGFGFGDEGTVSEDGENIVSDKTTTSSQAPSHSSQTVKSEAVYEPIKKNQTNKIVREDNTIHHEKIENAQTSRTAVGTSSTQTIPKSARREVPASTRLVVEPNNGNIQYKESTASIKTAPTRVENHKLTSKVKNNRKQARYTSRIDEYGKLHVPANYELAEVRYDIDPRTMVNTTWDNSYYIDDGTTMLILPIKSHYNRQRKQNDKKFPWPQVALGVAAIAGLSLIFREEDDGPFWN